MNTTKKLIASILIICMFLRLPESEAKASEANDTFTPAEINSDYLLPDSDHINCTGINTILSPCYTFQIYFSGYSGSSTLDIYEEDHSNYNPHIEEEYETLPWNDISEPPQTGVMIPVLHF